MSDEREYEVLFAKGVKRVTAVSPSQAAWHAFYSVNKPWPDEEPQRFRVVSEEGAGEYLAITIRKMIDLGGVKCPQ